MTFAESLSIADLSGDPHPHLARLRAAAPVVEVPALGCHLVVGRAAATEVLRDSKRFTVDDERFSTAQVVGASMLSTDGPAHVRYRRPFVPPFRPRQVEQRFDALIRERTADLVARIAATIDRDGSADVRPLLAGPLAASVIAVSLGLPDDDDHVAELLGWYRHIVASVSGVSEGRPVTAEGEAAMNDLRRAVVAGRGDTTTLLGEVAAVGDLSDDEIASNAGVVMFGGIETTEAMILNALWFVLGGDRVGDASASAASVPEFERSRGAQRQRSAPFMRPAWPGNAVEESLRLEPAAAIVDRYATADTVVGGVAIPAGAHVSVSLAAANRDPAEFAEPDRFDPTRPNLNRQLAFATGPHVCLGMDLARLQTVLALEALFARLPDLRLVEDSPPPAGLVFRKPPSLIVTM